MKAPREIKLWVARMRKRYGKKNGMLSCGVWDNFRIELMLAKNKRDPDNRSKHDNHSA